MNSYQFVARSPTGHKIKGVLNVDDEEVLKNIMIEHDCYLIRYKKKKNKKIKGRGMKPLPYHIKKSYY